MPDLNPAAVMAAHARHFDGFTRCIETVRLRPEEHCEPYRLAEALAAEQAKVARVEQRLNNADEHGLDDVSDDFAEGYWLMHEQVRVALADQPEQVTR